MMMIDKLEAREYMLNESSPSSAICAQHPSHDAFMFIPQLGPEPVLTNTPSHTWGSVITDVII